MFDQTTLVPGDVVKIPVENFTPPYGEEGYVIFIIRKVSEYAIDKYIPSMFLCYCVTHNFTTWVGFEEASQKPGSVILNDEEAKTYRILYGK